MQALTRKQVSRIILTRPAVEAGERLGYLPGTLTDKIDPYLRPLYDALNEMMDPELVPKLMATSTIEVAPARLHARPHAERLVRRARRGAEHDAGADEDVPDPARLRLEDGRSPGDITQVDLPNNVSGLRTVQKIVDGIDDIHFSHAHGRTDVVRHSLVGKIVNAYSRYDEERLAATAERREEDPDGDQRPRR